MKLYVAGVEGSDVASTLASDVIVNGFASYYYLRRQSSGVKRVREHVKSLIVDSGAHTFFASRPEIGSTTTRVTKHKGEDPEFYMREYLAWLKQAAPHLDYFVELDLGEIVGQPRVRGWRVYLEKAGLAEKCIIVYHPKAETWAEFLEWAEKWPSKYVALEGLRQGRALFDYVGCVRALYERGIRVHGFAMVKRRWLDRVPFYSVDSSSFMAGITYGAHFTNMGSDRFSYIRYSKPKSEASRQKAMRAAVKRGVDFERLTANTYSKEHGRDDIVLTAVTNTARAMQDMEAYYTRLWEARGIKWTEPKRRSSKRSRSVA